MRSLSPVWGIPSSPSLLSSSFRERFFNKGVMRAFLQQVPVRLMEHGQLGVIGAAGMYLEGHTAQPPQGAATQPS